MSIVVMAQTGHLIKVSTWLMLGFLGVFASCLASLTQ